MLNKRCQNENKSVIDFILVNNQMYNYFTEMCIDENKEQYDLSDHNLLTATFKIEYNKGRRVKQLRSVHEHYKITEDTKMKFQQEMEKLCTEKDPINIIEFENYIRISANITMKVRKSYSTNPNGEKEKEWMTDDIRKNIKLRKQLNRIVRNSTGMDAVSARTNYAEQKTKTQILIREAIQKQEKKRLQK